MSNPKIDIAAIMVLVKMIIAAIGDCPKARSLSDDELVDKIQNLSRLEVIQLWLQLGRKYNRSERRDCMKLVTEDAPLLDREDAVNIVAEVRRGS